MEDIKKRIEAAIFQSLMYMGKEEYPFYDDYYIRYADFNEWGDDLIRNKGVQVIYRGEFPWDKEEIYSEYKIGQYDGGMEGNIVFFGRQIADDMAKDIMKDCFDYVEESDVVEDFLAY